MNRFSSLVSRVLLASICFSTCFSSVYAASEPQWVRVSSQNFVIYSDAGEKRALAIAERLESFRGLLTSLFPAIVDSRRTEQLPVVAFKGDGGLKPYKPVYNGKTVSVAGLFLGGDVEPLILLDASAWENSSHVIFHEYIHRVLSGSDLPVPLWFNEGVAEFYSTASTNGGKAQVGMLVPGHIMLLQDRTFMPLEQLFATKHDSPEYNERNKQSIFYAESWALLHYCVLNKDPKMPGRLIDFAKRQGRGENDADAFKAAFGTDMETMAKALRQYVRGATLPIVNITFPPPPIQTAHVDGAPPAEVSYYLGKGFALTQNYADAERLFRQAAANDTASALPYEGLGLIALRQGKRDEARASFAEAAKRDSKSYIANYYFAAASMSSLDASSVPAVKSALERAIALNPGFADSYQLMSFISLRTGDAKSAISWAERGLKVAPQDGRVRLALAYAQAAGGDVNTARKSAQRVVDTADDEQARAGAASLLAQLDSYSSGTLAPDPMPVGRDDINEGRPTLIRKTDSGDEAHIQIASHEVRGIVTRIECDKTTTTVYVLVNGAEVVFKSDSVESLIIATLTLDELQHETIDCGKTLQREAFVQFEPDPTNPKGGQLKAVMFVKSAK